jgi:hypothetical protein
MYAHGMSKWTWNDAVRAARAGLRETEARIERGEPVEYGALRDHLTATAQEMTPGVHDVVPPRGPAYRTGWLSWWVSGADPMDEARATAQDAEVIRYLRQNLPKR